MTLRAKSWNLHFFVGSALVDSKENAFFVKSLFLIILRSVLWIKTNREFSAILKNCNHTVLTRAKKGVSYFNGLKTRVGRQISILFLKKFSIIPFVKVFTFDLYQNVTPPFQLKPIGNLLW